MILEKILRRKATEVENIIARNLMGQWERDLADLPRTLDFLSALKIRPAIVAEVKRTSPSRGRLRENFDPVELARAYERGGAAAISVLTDEIFFEGHSDHLREVKRTVSLPVLRKDFIIHECQLLETRILGADAVLLIAAILEQEKLERFIRLARSLDLTPLVEVHSERELLAALEADAELIGINNRNLSTFETDIALSIKLAPLIPRQVTVISESGIKSRADIEVLMKAGIGAFLIGEGLVGEADVEEKLRELLKGGSQP
ncbi:MAG: indole-3-glycerol phosphate synthase TrpC [Smithellaceae bacterium]|nr:indole-3-glycerol phosphate synthase TrpC [Smithellaceae bacterium]